MWSNENQQSINNSCVALCRHVKSLEARMSDVQIEEQGARRAAQRKADAAMDEEQKRYGQEMRVNKSFFLMAVTMLFLCSA